MAVTAGLFSQWVAALSWPRGALRLALLRFGILMACFLPGRMALKGAIDTALGGDPRIVASAPIDFGWLMHALKDGGAAGIGLLVVGAVVFAFMEQLLTVTALVIADPHRGRAPPQIWRTLWADGMAFLVRFVRIAVLGLVFMVVEGFIVVKLTGGWATGDGYVASTGEHRVWTVQFWRGVLVFITVASLGAWTFWARVLVVADARRGVARAYFDAARVFWRAPLSAYGVFALVSGAVVLLTGRIWVSLIGPDSSGAIVWSILMLLQCAVWMWCWHAARLLYAQPELNDIGASAEKPLFRRPAFLRR